MNKIILKTIYDKGTNIYKILAIWRNIHKKILPDEVLNLVCKGFIKRMDYIPKEKHWAYLSVALKRAWEQWNAKKQVDEAEIWKTGETMHRSVKNVLLKSLGG